MVFSVNRLADDQSRSRPPDGSAVLAFQWHIPCIVTINDITCLSTKFHVHNNMCVCL